MNQVALLLGASLLLVMGCRPPGGVESRNIPRIDETDRPALFQAAYRERFAAVEAAPDDIQALTALAAFYHANGFLSEAATLYQRLNSLQPDSARWPYLLFLVQRDLGALSQAHESLQKAVQLDPQNPLLILTQADVNRKNGNTALARTQYEACLNHKDYRAHALVGLATIAINQEQWEQADSLLKAAQEASPQMASAYRLRATVLEKLGRPEEARMTGEIAYALQRQLDPHDPWIDEVRKHCYDPFLLNAYAGMKSSEQRFEEAEAILRRLCALYPDDARAHYDLALTMERRGDNSEERRKLLRRTIELDPGMSDAYMALALAISAEGDIPGALETLQTAIRNGAETAGVHRMVGAIYEQQGRLDDAEASYRRGIELNDLDHESHAALGNLLWKRGDEQGAIAQYQRAVDASMLAAKPRALLASYYAEQGDYDRAVKLFTEARTAAPQMPGVDDLLVPALLASAGKAAENNDREKAESAYRRALEINPASAPAFTGLFWSCFKAGSTEEARRLAEQFLQSNPRHPLGYRQLAIAQARAGHRTDAIATIEAGLAALDADANRDAVEELHRMLDALRSP